MLVSNIPVPILRNRTVPDRLDVKEDDGCHFALYLGYYDVVISMENCRPDSPKRRRPRATYSSVSRKMVRYSVLCFIVQLKREEFCYSVSTVPNVKGSLSVGSEKSRETVDSSPELVVVYCCWPLGTFYRPLAQGFSPKA